MTHRATSLVRTARTQLDALRRTLPGCIRTWCAGWSRSASLDAGSDPRRAVVRPSQLARTVARIQRLRAGLGTQLRRDRARARPARPDRRARSRVSREGGHHRGHEPADPEVAGGAARRADQGPALGHTEIDGEHLLLALLDQPEGSSRGCSIRQAPTPTRCGGLERELPAGRGDRPGRRSRARSSSPSACRAARRRRTGGQAAQGRVRVGRAPAGRPARRGYVHAAGRLLAEQGVTRDAFLSALTGSAATSASPRRCRR